MTKDIAQNRAFIFEAAAGKVKDESSCIVVKKTAETFFS